MDSVGDHAEEDDDHADEKHEMSGMLAGREPGACLGRLPRERVLAQVEEQPEDDRCCAELREEGNWRAAAAGPLLSWVFYR